MPPSLGRYELRRELGIEDTVELTPPLPHADMAALFRSAQVLVSPTTHDGTPNSLLEGMACGCFPVAGDQPGPYAPIAPETGAVGNPATHPAAHPRSG